MSCFHWSYLAEGQKIDWQLALKQELKEELKQDLQKNVEVIKALKDDMNQDAHNVVAGVPPYHLIMANYAELKGQDTAWNSQPFYTHPGGYQCGIIVWPNGYYPSKGKGTHVSVQLCTAPGPFDGTLPWTAKATFTLELLNQHRDQDHKTITTWFQWEKPTEAHMEGLFSNTFIPHAELGWNAGKQTKYLHEDCLRFRIARIELDQ